MKLLFYLLLFSSIILSDDRSIYSVGDTLTLSDQYIEFNVCHSDENYLIGDSFSFSNLNGDLNGGDYKISLISMNATW